MIIFDDIDKSNKNNGIMKYRPVLYLDTTNSNSVTELKGVNFDRAYNKSFNLQYIYFENSSESYWQMKDNNISQFEINLLNNLNFTDQS